MTFEQVEVVVLGPPDGGLSHPFVDVVGKNSEAVPTEYNNIKDS